jgi:hypothetical protein
MAIPLYIVLGLLIAQKNIDENAILSKNNQILPFLNKKIKNLHLFSSFYMTLPISNEPFFRKNGIWYNINNLDDIFKSNTKVKNMYKTFHEKQISNRIHGIDIPTNIVYCTGKNTTHFLDYETKITLDGDGDGIVPKYSLLIPKLWKTNPKFIHVNNMEHSKINSYLPFMKMISSNKDELIF